MDIFQYINDIEKKFPVSTWRIGDIDVWPIVRIGLFYENNAAQSACNSFENNKVSFVVYRVKTLFKSLYNIIADYKKNESIHKADVVFLGFNATRTVKLSSGEMACQNLDMIKKELFQREISTCSLELLSSIHSKTPRYTKSNLYINFEIIKKRCIYYFKKNKDSVYLPQIDEVRIYLQKNGVSISNCEDDVIRKKVNIIKAYSECFAKVLEYILPKMGVVVCWYSLINMAFLRECRKKGIPCVDIQHGAAGSTNHKAYSRWINVPIGGYNTMPTNFWCWSDKDALAINEWYDDAVGNHRAFVGGNYTQAYLIKNDIGNVWKKKVEQIIQYDKIRILLTLQPGVVFPEWFTNYIISSENIQWLIRKHPVMDTIQQEFINKVKQKDNVEYEVASNCPLVILLEVCHLHITSYSSVVLEAEEYGVKSVLLNQVGMDAYQDSISRGTCYFAPNNAALDDIIGCKKWYQQTDFIKNSVVDVSGIEQLVNLIQRRYDNKLYNINCKL